MKPVDPVAARVRLASIHPGESAESIRQATAFDYDNEDCAEVTPEPDADELALLRGPVCTAMRETYPEFCRRTWGAG